MFFLEKKILKIISNVQITCDIVIKCFIAFFFSFFNFFQFLIDNENSCFRLSSVCGIVKPYSCLKVMVKFSPAFAMNYYRRVTCLIHNQVSLVSETGKQISVEKLGNGWEVFCPVYLLRMIFSEMNFSVTC